MTIGGVFTIPTDLIVFAVIWLILAAATAVVGKISSFISKEALGMLTTCIAASLLYYYAYDQATERIGDLGLLSRLALPIAPFAATFYAGVWRR